MLELGRIQKLIMVKKTDFGVYLAESTESPERVLLPKKQIPAGAKNGDEIEVFLYRDSKDRLIATTKKPYITIDEPAILEVKEITGIGAFLDMGLERDLLLPYHEMKRDTKEHDRIPVKMYVDKSGRLAATQWVKTENDALFRVEEDARHILRLLNERGGKLPVGDRSDAEEIKKECNLSRNAFKKGVGHLLKEGKVEIADNSVVLKGGIINEEIEFKGST
ncbi:MAG: RNA-binding protein [Lachnospiraceae bacterium]|nr:RNA-binding protein [Lachnospiraceae bacterium]